MCMTCTQCRQKSERVSDALELQLQTDVTYGRVLETEPRSSTMQQELSATEPSLQSQKLYFLKQDFFFSVKIARQVVKCNK